MKVRHEVMLPVEKNPILNKCVVCEYPGYLKPFRASTYPFNLCISSAYCKYTQSLEDTSVFPGKYFLLHLAVQSSLLQMSDEEQNNKSRTLPQHCTKVQRDERWTHSHVALQETTSHCKTSKFQKHYRNKPLLKQSFVEIPCPSGRKGVSFNEVRGSRLPAGLHPWRERGMESHTP